MLEKNITIEQVNQLADKAKTEIMEIETSILGELLSIKVRTTLPWEEKIQLVHRVVDSCITDGAYSPELFDDVFAVTFIDMMTNISLPVQEDGELDTGRAAAFAQRFFPLFQQCDFYKQLDSEDESYLYCLISDLKEDCKAAIQEQLRLAELESTLPSRVALSDLSELAASLKALSDKGAAAIEKILEELLSNEQISQFIEKVMTELNQKISES